MSHLPDRLAAAHAARPWQPRPRDCKPRSRWLAIGDPQTTFAKFLSILARNHLLDEHGYLREDVGLVSIGDHFDFDLRPHDNKSLAEAGRDSTNILRWLADHPSDQVVILLGNHDTARVMELAFESDESFAVARALAKVAMSEEPPGEKTRAFVSAFPRIPTPELAHRDYSSFAVDQRELVQQLLLAGRMRLACLGHHAGQPVLLTHASVAEAQVKELGVAPRAEPLVDALEARLASAVDHVRDAWERQELAALSLEPLHFAGRDGREGGGLLYHRVSKKEPLTGSRAPIAPRRFHPRDLPRRLVQLHGHTGHHKSLEELEGWHDLPPTRGGLRTLSVGESGIVYSAGIQPAREDHATVYMIDIEMNHRDVTDYPLLELEGVVA